MDARRSPSQHVNGAIGVARERLDSQRSHNEAGASLILALIFLVVVSMVVISLSGWTGNDMNNGSKFTSYQYLHSAADNAVEMAIQNVRYTYMSTASQPCLSGTSGPTSTWTDSNGQTVNVWCSAVLPTLDSDTNNSRMVTFDACPVAIDGVTITQAMCTTSSSDTPLLQAVVTFDDASLNGVSLCNADSDETCGLGMTVDSWAFSY
jgi:hypothetical protein